MVKEELCKRNIPRLLTMENGAAVENEQQWHARRAEILSILDKEIYGEELPAPLALTAEVIQREPDFCAGKATLCKVMLHVTLPQGNYSFALYTVIPNTPGPHPAFVHVNFRDAVPDRYMPSEEICDGGFAVLSLCYNDVTRDNDDFSDGLAGVFYGDKARRESDPGKIGMWAWAASRAMDYALTLPAIDAQRVAVVGHSRLGKTALLAGARDTRFYCAISNDSGCSGAAITRGKGGERVENIVSSFPYWFCPRYAAYAGREDAMPFDQHFLLACLAPRRVYVASAALDAWADPASEYLACVATSPVYELLGKAGLPSAARYPQPGDAIHDGLIAYHLRPGTHYLSRQDWQLFMRYLSSCANG